MFGVALKIVGYPVFLYWLTLSSVISLSLSVSVSVALCLCLCLSLALSLSLSLSLNVWCACVCVLLIYTFFVSIICVLWEQPSLISSNKRKYNFYKWIVFEKKLTVESYFF